LGLLNPETVLYDTDERGNKRAFTPDLTAVQEFVWTSYLEDLDNVKRLADGAPIVTIFNGDMTQGVGHPSHLVSTRIVDQFEIAYQAFRPLMALPNLRTLRIASGTASHIFSGQTSPLLITERLKAQCPAVDIETVFHGLGSVDSFTIDYAHHGPSSGIRFWTRGNQLRYYLKSIMLKDVADGREPPEMVTRGHFHDFWPETVWVLGKRDWKSDIILLPSYCGMNEYGRQATQSRSSFSIGLVALEIENGKLVNTHPFYRTPDLRTREEL